MARYWAGSRGRRYTSRAGSCDGSTETQAGRSCMACPAAIAGATAGRPPRASAAVLGRDRPGTVERGCRRRRRRVCRGRDALVPGEGRGGDAEYRATTAQWHADRRAKRPKVAKLAAHDALRTYVQDRLAGRISASDGTIRPGPEVHWIGRRHGRRQDRRW